MPLKSVNTLYHHTDEIEYGKKRMQLVNNLYSELNSAKLIQPTREDFIDKLPASKDGTRRLAALLEAISAWSFADQKQPAFQTLRSEGSYTPVTGRYEWALPLINSVYYHSQATDISRNYDLSKIYALTYHDKTVNLIDLVPIKYKEDAPFLIRWGHGRAKLNETWPDMEELFERIWKMDLKNLKETASTEEYESKLTEFYSNIAELVWLSGNTQPTQRGSGTFAELVVALLHIHHGLEPPILKLEFPQLDVLNITFPLSDYKKFFPYFFEPSTIPEHLRKSYDPSLTVYQQMQQLYREHNNALIIGAIKNIVNLEIWNAKGMQFLQTNLPPGIQEMQALNSINLSDYAEIAREHQSSSKPIFSEDKAQNFYKLIDELHTAEQQSNVSTSDLLLKLTDFCRDNNLVIPGMDLKEPTNRNIIK